MISGERFTCVQVFQYCACVFAFHLRGMADLPCLLNCVRTSRTELALHKNEFRGKNIARES